MRRSTEAPAAFAGPSALPRQVQKLDISSRHKGPSGQAAAAHNPPPTLPPTALPAAKAHAPSAANGLRGGVQQRSWRDTCGGATKTTPSSRGGLRKRDGPSTREPRPTHKSTMVRAPSPAHCSDYGARNRLSCQPSLTQTRTARRRRRRRSHTPHDPLSDLAAPQLNLGHTQAASSAVRPRLHAPHTRDVTDAAEGASAAVAGASRATRHASSVSAASRALGLLLKSGWMPARSMSVRLGVRYLPT